MLKKQLLFVFAIVLAAVDASSQAIDHIAGSYIKIDSISSSYEKGGKLYKTINIDTTLLTLNKDMSFSYKWSPMFGRHANEYIVTTGTWAFQKDSVTLNSKYQQGEHRFYESYKPEYGDSLVRIYVQTYDSLTGFFRFQYIGILKDTTKESEMLLPDKEHPRKVCSVTFRLSSVDKIVFYGDFGRMPVIIPKDKKSNHFVLQYNLSDDWDYQYFKDFRINISGNKAFLGGEEDIKIVLTKID